MISVRQIQRHFFTLICLCEFYMHLIVLVGCVRPCFHLFRPRFLAYSYFTYYKMTKRLSARLYITFFFTNPIFFSTRNMYLKIDFILYTV